MRILMLGNRFTFCSNMPKLLAALTIAQCIREYRATMSTWRSI